MNAIAEDLLKRVENDERLVKKPPPTPTLGTPDAVRTDVGTDGLQSGWLINGDVSVCGGVSYIFVYVDIKILTYKTRLFSAW